MRKLHMALAVSLLLLLAQQGALLHEVSHLCHSGKVDARAQPDSALEKTCELCLGFSQLAHPASHSVQSPQFEPAACVAGVFIERAVTPAASFTPRNRGPPACG